MKRQIQIKDLWQLQYFFGIEVSRGKQGVVLSQRKYIQDMLKTIGMLGSKHAWSPMDPNVVLDDTLSPKFEDTKR